MLEGLINEIIDSMAKTYMGCTLLMDNKVDEVTTFSPLTIFLI